jgi:hypothetical protein
MKFKLLTPIVLKTNLNAEALRDKLETQIIRSKSSIIDKSILYCGEINRYAFTIKKGADFNSLKTITIDGKIYSQFDGTRISLYFKPSHWYLFNATLVNGFALIMVIVIFFTLLAGKISFILLLFPTVVFIFGAYHYWRSNERERSAAIAHIKKLCDASEDLNPPELF